MENSTLYNIVQTLKRKYSLLFFFLLLMFIVFKIVLWSLNTSLIEINTITPSSYSVLGFSSTAGPKKSGTIKNKTTIRVKKGEYSVEVTRANETSSLFYIKTKGLFNKSIVNQTAGLVSSRNIVADAPYGCIVTTKPTLQTYVCNSEPLSGKNHIPASTTSPTYTTILENPTNSAKYVDAIDFNGSRYVVAKNYNTNEPGSSLYLYPVVDGKTSTNNAKLLSNAGNDWKVTATNKNIFIYDVSVAKGVLFDTELITAKDFALGLNNVDSMSLVDVALSEDGIYYLESSFVSEEREDAKPVVQRSIISFTDFSGVTSRSRTLSTEYSSIRVCGENIVCVLSGNRLDILDRNTGYTVLFSAPVINSVSLFDSKIYLESTRGVYVYSASTSSAETIFYNDRIRMCGLYSAERVLLGCVEDKVGRYTVQFSGGEQKAFGPEKLRLLLSDKEFIKSTTISNNIVFVTPNYGPFEYSGALNEYRYSSEKIQSTKLQLESLLKEIPNITGYTVINTLQELK